MPVCDLCGHLALSWNICETCARKAPEDRFQKAVNLNLQLNTIEEMIGRFVIENHQAKHYHKRVQALRRDAFLASGRYGDWERITLSGADNSVRIMHIGA